MIQKLINREIDRPLIAAHRGTYSGNFIQNTVAAFINSLHHKADIVEMDVELSKDGILYLMHTDMEKLLLNCEKSIRDMNSGEIDELGYINVISAITKQRVNRLDEALKALKGKCLINIDRAWDFFPQVFEEVKKYNMLDQVIFKSEVKELIFSQIKSFGHKINFMPIVKSSAEIEEAVSYGVDLIGFELLFEKDDDEFAQSDFIKRMHDKGYILWVNALSIWDNCNMCAMHSDEISVLENMDLGWGWLIDKGYDVIQTDWPLLLYNYINERKN